MSIRDKLLSGPLGFGAAPLGNMFRNIPEEEAAAAVDAAWQQGISYFDTAPLYGAGLSEMSLGHALAKHKCGKYVLQGRPTDPRRGGIGAPAPPREGETLRVRPSQPHGP